VTRLELLTFLESLHNLSNRTNPYMPLICWGSYGILLVSSLLAPNPIREQAKERLSASSIALERSKTCFVVVGDPILSKGRPVVDAEGNTIKSTKEDRLFVCSVNGSTAEIDTNGKTTKFAKVTKEDYPEYLANIKPSEKDTSGEAQVNDLNQTEI
jgi:hypothetical protein